MLSGPSLRTDFVSSITSLILPDFPLTSFHLAEASQSAFSWLYTLLRAIVQKYLEIYFIHFFSAHLAMKICFVCTT